MSAPSRTFGPAAAHLARPQRTARLRALAAAGATLRAWRSRARERRALAWMTALDLADLCVPPGMAAAEASRWPWQQPSRSWQLLERERQDLIDAARWS